MTILDGKKISAQIRREVAARVGELSPDRRPTLAVVQVGDDPASTVYVKSKLRACAECGISSRYHKLESSIERGRLLSLLEDLSAEAQVSGILLQLPLPPHLDVDEAMSAIDPHKDVDGFHPYNMGLLAAGEPRFVPCTPLGIREMLLRHRIETAGREVVVVGRSTIVGKPLALLLMTKGKGGDATVTVCHSRTESLAQHTTRADILVAAIGKPGFIKGDMVKRGAVVIDVGVNRVEDRSRKSGYRLAGDVDFEAVAEKTSYISPVPGGVGPMTVAMLMVNTLKAYFLQIDGSDAVY